MYIIHTVYVERYMVPARKPGSSRCEGPQDLLQDLGYFFLPFTEILILHILLSLAVSCCLAWILLNFCFWNRDWEPLLPKLAPSLGDLCFHEPLLSALTLGTFALEPRNVGATRFLGCPNLL